MTTEQRQDLITILVDEQADQVCDDPLESVRDWLRYGLKGFRDYTDAELLAEAEIGVEDRSEGDLVKKIVEECRARESS